MRLLTQKSMAHQGLAFLTFILLLLSLDPLNYKESTIGSIIKTSIIGYLLLALNLFLNQPPAALQSEVSHTSVNTPQSNDASSESNLALRPQAQSSLFQPTSPTSALLEETLNEFFPSTKTKKR